MKKSLYFIIIAGLTALSPALNGAATETLSVATPVPAIPPVGTLSSFALSRHLHDGGVGCGHIPGLEILDTSSTHFVPIPLASALSSAVPSLPTTPIWEIGNNWTVENLERFFETHGIETRDVKKHYGVLFHSTRPYVYLKNLKGNLIAINRLNHWVEPPRVKHDPTPSTQPVPTPSAQPAPINLVASRSLTATVARVGGAALLLGAIAFGLHHFCAQPTLPA